MSKRPSGKAKATIEVLEAARDLVHRAVAVAERLHGAEGLSAGRRGILLSLARLGPQTVPELARARPVSRQHIQTVANPLIEQGLVERVPNPAHQRSHLLRLTASGREAVAGIERREKKFFQALDTGVRLGDLRNTAALLSELRDALEGHA
ncbi:MAG: MarR family winged helix-turn-helix transcriptional regulator [Planctomycetota bacterium]|jgi:DNA-binding MarR family transcriptional regulator